MSDSVETPARPAATATALTIDRLVFDVPGLTRTDAEAIAQEVRVRLASTGITDAPPTIGVTLDPPESARAQLAARIIAALLERLV